MGRRNYAPECQLGAVDGANSTLQVQHRIGSPLRFGRHFPLEILGFAGTIGPMFLPRRLCGLFVALLGFAGVESPTGVCAQGVVATEIRTVDADTGFAVTATVRSASSLPNLEVHDASPGRMFLRGAPTRHSIILEALGYHPAAASIDLAAADTLPIVLRLAPERSRAELHPETVLGKTRGDSTLFLGFVADDNSGGPLAQVRVRATPSGIEVITDESGYFELLVPCPRDGRATQLSFEKPGFQSEIRRHLDLWPGGDWTYRVRLSAGTGARAVDERQTRRWSMTHPAREPIHSDPIATVPNFIPAATDPINLTIRVPRMIRVLYTNEVFYETLENYCRHVLPSEWISSWGSYTGGSNSLQAGAVALRTYAIGYVNQPLAASYDICATTSCQVYNPAVTSSRTDQAVAQTAGYVMVNSSTAIPRGLTEYSAENNQLGMSCGDGFTAPSGGCLADPVCAGEAEFGHGRGMCQWGTVKWATGLKFPGNNFSNTTLTNGQSRRDWIWIAQHYYPNLTLVRGTSLVVGDDVRATTANLSVRLCPGDSITNGVNCPSVGSVPLGATGLVLAGPEHVSSDGAGYVWWYVQWSTGPVGWVVENYLARIIQLPPAPTELTATALSSTRALLAWNDPSQLENGFQVERAFSAGGPWSEIALVPTNVTTVTVSNLSAQTTYYFRVRAFNLGGDSAYSGPASVTTPGTGSLLEPIADQFVDEEKPLRLVAKVLNGEVVQPLMDFEQFTSPPPNGTVLFRAPNFSGSTSGFLDASPNVSSVTGAMPPGQSSARSLAVSCSFSNSSNGWLRLTTSAAATLPNPVIDFTRRLRFDIHTDRAVRIALGLRETTNAAGTTLGSDGGTSGAIEWAGVSGRTNGRPLPVRLVPSGSWQTLTFDLPAEPVTSFVNGNGVLATASGLGVFEHLVVVPEDGAGVYNLFLDNFALVNSRVFQFSLEPDAPAGATIGASTGEFVWTPTESQGPGTNIIGIRVTESTSPGQSDVETFSVTVREINRAPVIAPTISRWIHAGTMFVITNLAEDPDLPANLLIFDAAVPLPAGASLDSTTGVLTWAVPDSLVDGTNLLAIRVSDDGSPAMTATNFLAVRTSPRPLIEAGATLNGEIELRWTGIPGRRYQLQYAVEVDAAFWINLGEPVTAQADEIVLNQPGGTGQRFYRLLLLD